MPTAKDRVLALTLATALTLISNTAARAAVASAWGYNYWGAVGDGTTTNRRSPVVLPSLPNGVTAVAAGYTNSYAIRNGALYAWGSNQFGTVIPSTSNTLTLTPIPIATLTTGVTAVSVGTRHTLALQNGAVFAWGYNSTGEIGDGTSANYRTTPTPVTGLSSGVTAISAGAGQSLAVRDGAAFSWGYNEFGQLGDNSITNRLVPTPIVGLTSGVTAVSAGDGFSLALRDGAVYAWGSNLHGSLGDGTNTDRHTPVPVTGLTGGVTAISAGYQQALAVKGGHVYAWGYNVFGQLGDGTLDTHLTPEPIGPADMDNIVAVASGLWSGYALAADGSLWAWGQNGNGQLGLGSSVTQFLTPQHVLPPAGYLFTSIDVGDDEHAVANLIPIPEPSAFALLAITALPLSLRRRAAGPN